MFNAEKEVQKIVEFIQNYYKKNNLEGAVIGISGGKDSAVAVALFTKALGKDKVIGVSMPCHSKVEDYNDAKIVCDYYNIELKYVDLTDVFDLFKSKLDSNENSEINFKPRLRMATLYYLAALNERYLVVGTSNKCEIYVGYFTKFGDGASDINVLADYLVSEVIKMGKYLKVPEKHFIKHQVMG